MQKKLIVVLLLVAVSLLSSLLGGVSASAQALSKPKPPVIHLPARSKSLPNAGNYYFGPNLSWSCGFNWTIAGSEAWTPIVT